MDYCFRILEKFEGRGIREAAKPFVEEWLCLHHSRVGVKKAEDLNVLFLAGPDPTADLMMFQRAGVPFANIRAVEGDRPTFKQATNAPGREGMPIKLHNGSLKDFFAIVPQR